MSAGAVALGQIAAVTGARLVGAADVPVSALAYDTRRVVPAGSLFACVRGRDFDSHTLAGAAVAAGAAALLVAQELALPVPQLVVPDTRLAMGLAAALIYGYPARRLRMIGVTGTKGKTTTTYMIKQLLEKARHQVGLLGTTGLVIGDQPDPTPFSTTTTPEAPDLQVMLARMLAATCDTAVMEVSSHAVSLQRIAGTEFDIAVFTNIAPDHLDFHPTFADYMAAKVGFFRQAGAPGDKGGKGAVVNRDDPHWEAFARSTAAPVITVGVRNVADLQAVDIASERGCSRYRLTGRFGEAAVTMPLPGIFNVYNALCAAGAALHAGMELAEIAAALAALKGVPGRFEPIEAGQDFEVYVDYAHTGPSMENVLQLTRSFARGRVIVVFGAGGDRPRARRTEMGEAAGRLADYVIITADNPRSEDPADICAQIAAAVAAAGLPGERYEVIVNRREAINRAVELARPGDVIIIAGKGHEPYQEVQGVRTHFDDREEAYNALRARGV